MNRIKSKMEFFFHFFVETRHDIAPRFTWTPLTNIEVIRGQTAILECAAEGWPVPVIKWTRYGGQLSVERHSQTLGKLLLLQSCTFSNICNHALFLTYNLVLIENI